VEEHFGIVPLEAMYSKLPVIACNSGGPKETVLHGITGYLCEPTPNSFADHLQQLIDHNEIHLFRERGHEHVRAKFSLNIFTDRLENIVFLTRDQINFDATITYYALLSIFAFLPLLVLLFLI
jgi:alpha-1,3/alpha-1,6-mannosyltransferase